MKRRFIFILILIVILPIGLATRKYGSYFPYFIATYAGDTLWATVAYLLFRIVFIRRSSFYIFCYALTFAFLIEIFQLYHAAWIDTIRNTLAGALILGNTFLWSDFLCYLVGVVLGFLIDSILPDKM